MTDTCFFCNLKFQENSIQYNRRIQKYAHKMCRDCYRIGNAEERQKMRIQNYKKEMSLSNLAHFYKEVYGQVTPALLMRKMKLTQEKATELASQTNEA